MDSASRFSPTEASPSIEMSPIVEASQKTDLETRAPDTSPPGFCTKIKAFVVSHKVAILVIFALVGLVAAAIILGSLVAGYVAQVRSSAILVAVGQGVCAAGAVMLEIWRWCFRAVIQEYTAAYIYLWPIIQPHCTETVARKVFTVVFTLWAGKWLGRGVQAAYRRLESINVCSFLFKTCLVGGVTCFIVGPVKAAHKRLCARNDKAV